MGDDGGPKSEKELREARLAEALRANLFRRKAQAKSRRAGEGDPRAGLAVAGARDGSDRDQDAGAADPHAAAPDDAAPHRTGRDAAADIDTGDADASRDDTRR